MRLVVSKLTSLPSLFAIAILAGSAHVHALDHAPYPDALEAAGIVQDSVERNGRRVEGKADARGVVTSAARRDDVLSFPSAAPAKAEAVPMGSTELVLACAADNDLYETLKKNGVSCHRFDGASTAVASAKPGGGLLILADDYPDEPATVDSALLEAAAQKQLRIFIEYLQSSVLAF